MQYAIFQRAKRNDEFRVREHDFLSAIRRVIFEQLRPISSDLRRASNFEPRIT